jgi:hypothetical protein
MRERPRKNNFDNRLAADGTSACAGARPLADVQGDCAMMGNVV